MDGAAMHALIERLYPICRSITGYGIRETLGVLQGRVPLSVERVPSHTRVYDWQVPAEWRLHGAVLRDPSGRTVADVRDHSLHLVSYSVPQRAELDLEALRPHLHTLAEHPDWIPYRTAYYQPAWGFCLAHRDFQALADGTYHVEIETELVDGELNYGELLIPGRSNREILFFSHACHPSLCNDNLAGLAVTCALAEWLLGQDRLRYSYRFVWGPGTIGSITWLARNHDRLDRVAGGLVSVLLGDDGPLQYKPTVMGDTLIDRAATYVCGRRGGRIRDFEPYGYDERQFASPGIRLPVGRLTRTPNGEYPQYHTSADDLEFVRPARLQESLEALMEFVDVLEHDRRYVNLQPYCEPQLGRRGLYRSGGGEDLPQRNVAMLWMLNQSDGQTSVLDVANRSKLPFGLLKSVADELTAADLLAPAAEASEPEAKS